MNSCARENRQHDTGIHKGDLKMTNATKTLSDVKADMSALYNQVRDGVCDLKLAAELANITGKYLKAVQLEFARDVFLSNKAEPHLLTVKTDD